MDAKRIYELMVLTAWSDGAVDASEALAVHELATTTKGLEGLSGKAALASAVKARLDEKGLEDALRETAEGLTTREERELAFRCCARVLQADGEFDAEEAAALASLQELLALSTEDVKRLFAAAR